MNQTKSIRSLVIFLSLCISSLTFAQGPGGGGPPGGGGGMQQGPPSAPTNKQIKKMVTKLSKEIGLSEKQEESVLETYQEHYEVVEEKLSESSRPERSEMEALELELQKEVKELLTDEQIVKYKTYLKEQEKNKKGRP